MTEGVLAGRVHMAGVGGAGMLPLAICLKQAGWSVSGEDDRLSSEAREYLRSYGIEIQALETLPESVDTVELVYSSAIQDSHHAIREARRRGLRIVPRGRALAALAKEKRSIAIAGSHGKTSTCGIVIDLLESIGESPSYALGGLFSTGKAPGRWNDSEWMVIEVDESDGTIDAFFPEIAIILNADHDHHAYYRSETEYLAAFARLAERASKGVALPRALKERIGYEVADRHVVFPDSVSDAAINSNQIGDYSLDNQKMALAGLTAAGFKFPSSIDIGFTPIKRRQAVLYFSPRLTVFEDYAHHPVEISAFRSGLQRAYPGKTIAVFQPHRYSRTRFLKSELARELSQFQYVYLLDVYEASEEPIEGGSSQDLLECLESISGNCQLVSSQDSLFCALQEQVGVKDNLNIVFLGAGTTDALAKEFARRLEAQDTRWGGLFSKLAGFPSPDAVLRSGEPLLQKTTLRVGGAAEMYLEPASEEALVEALSHCHAGRIPVYPLGRGSNLIVPDEGVPGLVIRLSNPIWRRFEHMDDGSVRVGGGMRIKELCSQACRLGLEGFEFLEGIPGSVGGSLRMNAGAMGGWIFDLVKSVRFAKYDGGIVEANAEDLSVGYRHCLELEQAIAIDVVMTPKAIGQRQADLRRAIDVYQSKRKESQPREPSAGCIFKNPEGDSAGRLIEELGLKGTAIGGAEISQTHGNFIINRGGATSQDVIELVRLVKREARSRRQVDLEPEALLFGMRWEEALG